MYITEEEMKAYRDTFEFLSRMREEAKKIGEKSFAEVCSQTRDDLVSLVAAFDEFEDKE